MINTVSFFIVEEKLKHREIMQLGEDYPINKWQNQDFYILTIRLQSLYILI